MSPICSTAFPVLSKKPQKGLEEAQAGLGTPLDELQT